MTTPYIVFSRKNCSAIRACVLENYGYIRYELPFINALAVEVPDEKLPAIQAHRRVALIARDGSVSKLPFSAQQGKAGRGSLCDVPDGAPDNTPARAVDGAQGNPASGVLNNEPARAVDGAQGGVRVLRGSEARRLSHMRPSSARKNSLSFFENGGFGVTIAVIDTGVAPHYDLVKPHNRIVAFKDFINHRTQPYDDDGHGTHVAGIAAGNGYAMGSAHLFHGTAPLAQIAAVKALDETGGGTTSDILAAMQWVFDHAEKYNIKVVNLSLGVEADAENALDPLLLGTAALVARGLTVVTAAGNSGPAARTVTSPGTSPFVITVGSCSGSGKIPDFSSRGPTLSGLHKPDLVAPGVDIISLEAASCKHYLAQSGTSMSCPYVSGAAACLYAENPHLSPREVKSLLMRMLTPLSGASRDSQGRGALFL